MKRDLESRNEGGGRILDASRDEIEVQATDIVVVDAKSR
jgi:hypothetical protein